MLDSFNEMRKKSGMSLDELSEKSGVPKGTLSKITSGITKAPALETMRSLVHTMGYTLNDLDEEESPPEPSANDSERLTQEEIMHLFAESGLVPTGRDLTEEDVRSSSVVSTKQPHNSGTQKVPESVENQCFRGFFHTFLSMMEKTISDCFIP